MIHSQATRQKSIIQVYIYYYKNKANDINATNDDTEWIFILQLWFINMKGVLSTIEITIPTYYNYVSSPCPVQQ